MNRQRPALRIALAAALAVGATLAPATLRAADPPGVAGLIARTLPGQGDRFAVEPWAGHGSTEAYSIAGRDGKIVLSGSTPVATASALLHYLEHDGRADLSWNGGDYSVPAALPAPTAYDGNTRFKYRFAYNYCTHGYTMAHWHWPQWQREIDWLAMHGVNLALVIEGQEQVWIDALRPFGYTEAQVRDWLVLPAHQPWQFMSNMESYGGPMSPALVQARSALARQVIDRMRELGVEPVLQGYYGIVPADFKTRFPNAKVHAQGKWGGGLNRPDMLDPADPMFAKVAAAFYAAQTRLYGPSKFYAADPFHEGGSTKGVDLPGAARAMYAAMDAASPSPTWVFQSWQANPRQPMLDALDKRHVLVIDLICEHHENWKRRGSFGNTPWLWGCINNFGGNTGVNGRLAWVGDRPAAAAADPAAGPMSGVAAVPEGSQTMPALWDRFFGSIWQDRPTDATAWTTDYVARRYKADDVEARAAWQGLLDTLYADKQSGWEGTVNSGIVARPSFNPNEKARGMASMQEPYALGTLVDAWGHLIAAAPACGGSDGYRYDLADVTRQVLADLGSRYRRELVRACNDGDKAEFHRVGAQMLGLIQDMDSIVGTRREFLLGTWIADARAWGSTPAESDRLEQDARELITIWATPTNLADYANKQWAGLLDGFYRERWARWLDAVEASMGSQQLPDPKAIATRVRAFEVDWTRQREPHATTPTGDTIAIARELFDRYANDARRELAPEPRSGKNAVPPLGTWSPKDVSPTFKPTSWDATPAIRAAGKYRVVFQYTNGHARLDVKQVTLTNADGAEVARDAHDGTTGDYNFGNVYRIAVPEGAPSARYTLVAQVRADGGTDSNGTVTVVPE